jgi:microcystin-dependent protein
MSDPFVGEIGVFAFSFAPVGWLQCSGQVLSISQYTVLFSLIGTAYGGDGVTTFALPNLKARFAVGCDSGNFPYSYPGSTGGAETVALAVNQLPAHTHTARASSNQANQRGPGGNTWAQEAMGQDAVYSSASPNVDMAYGTIANAGGGQAHQNIPPYLVLNFCIATTGVYPTRP